MSRLLHKSLLLPALLPALTSPLPAQDAVMEHALVLKVPLGRLWQDCTTPDGLAALLGAEQVAVDLRLDGAITARGPADAAGAAPLLLQQRVLALVPFRMLALQTAAPADASDEVRRLHEVGWEVQVFEPLGPDRTRLRILGCGYRGGAEYAAARRRFDARNNELTVRLLRRYSDARDSGHPAGVRGLLQRMIGGHWLAETPQPDAAPAELLRMEVQAELGDTFALHWWAGADGAPLPAAAAATFWHDRSADAFAFLWREPDGAIATGFVRGAGDQLHLVGERRGADGAQAPFRLQFLFDADDGLFVVRGEQELRLQRTGTVPERWRVQR